MTYIYFHYNRSATEHTSVTSFPKPKNEGVYPPKEFSLICIFMWNILQLRQVCMFERTDVVLKRAWPTSGPLCLVTCERGALTVPPPRSMPGPCQNPSLLSNVYVVNTFFSSVPCLFIKKKSDLSEYRLCALKFTLFGV